MNSKKINYLNALYIFIMLILMVLLLVSSTMITKITPFLNNGLVNFVINNYTVITVSTFITIIVFSIISTIQNKKNKKMIFWNIVLIVSIVYAFVQSFLSVNMELEEGIRRFIFGAIPIIIAIVNLCLIKKNKPKKIAIVSYILVIIFCLIYTFIEQILELFDYYIVYPNWMYEIIELIWLVYAFVSVILMFIHIRSQEDVTESNKRKNVNIIIYGIVQTIIVLGLFITVLYPVICCKINSSKLDNEVLKVKQEITEHNNKNLVILTEKDSKYGLIDENGEEIIKTEYDNLSINTFRYNNQEVEYVIAKKDDNFYFILKDKTVIDINKQYSSYIKNYYKYYYEDYNKRKVDTEFVDFNLKYYFNRAGDSNVVLDEEDDKNNNKHVLEYADDYYDEKEDVLYDIYKLNNGIELLVSEENDDGTSTVIIRKDNQIIEKDTDVLLPFDGTDIQLYSNGSIPFANFKKKTQGWYDLNTGKATTILGKYKILDVTEKFVIIKNYNSKDKEEMLVENSGAGRTVISARIIDKCSEGFIITDKDYKTFYVDEKVSFETDEYNFIEKIERKNNALLFIGITIDKNNKTKCVLFDSAGRILTKENYSKIGNNIDWYSYSVSKYKSYDSSDEEYRGFFGEEYEDKYSNSYIDDDDDDDDDEDTNLNNNSSIDYSKINLNGNNKYSSNNYKFSDLNNSNIKLNKVNDSIDISNMEYSIPKDYIEGYSSDYMYKYGRKIEDISENQDMVELGCFFKRELTDEENLYLNEYIRFESSDSDVLDNIVNTEIINKDGVNWFKVKIDLTSSKQKIVYIYATQIDDMIFNYMYEDYDNNNEDVVNQIFDSIKLK